MEIPRGKLWHLIIKKITQKDWSSLEEVYYRDVSQTVQQRHIWDNKDHEANRKIQ